MTKHNPILKTHWKRYKSHFNIDKKLAEKLIKPYCKNIINKLTLLSEGCANTNYKVELENERPIIKCYYSSLMHSFTYHRDYSSRAGDISLYIFNDALEIHNIGHLFGGLTVDQLFLKHPSRRRNEKIAQVFYARKLIDRFGGGTRRILRLCADQDLPVPEFSEEADGFQVRFPFKEPIGPQKVVETAKPELSPRQAEIIQVLEKHRPLSTKDLREKLTNPPTERWLRDDLNNLMNLGIIAAEGATNKRKWVLSRRL